MPPQLTFFTELAPNELVTLLNQDGLIPTLQKLNASLAVGLLDLSAERAAAIRQVNQAGIPVTAWLLLPKEEGYWFNLHNFPQAAAFYKAFKSWAKEEKLHFQWVGLDIEPDINEIYTLINPSLHLAGKALRRLLKPSNYREKQQAYGRLADQIREDGWQVEAYHTPLISDALKSHSTVIQRVFGLVDFPVDRKVFMLYTSFVRGLGPAFLQVYAADTDSVGIGNTGGGVENPDEPPYLSWEEFSRDLLLAHAAGKTMHIFSLEGCVRQGFLTRLLSFDWNQPVLAPAATHLHLARVLLQALLWLFQRPWAALLAAGLLLLRPRRKTGK